MASTLLFPADSLTQAVPEEEQDWFYTESEPEGIRGRPHPRPIPSDQKPAPPGTLTSEEITYQDFIDDYTSDPFKAVEELLSFVDLGLVTTTKATEWLFPVLIEERGELKEVIYKNLLTLDEAETILKLALSEYAKYGKEERLTLAAALLGDLGVRALPSLRSLARTNLPECELFVPLIAHLSDVSMHDRLEILAYLVSNPSPDVRHSLLWALRAFSPYDVKQLLYMLSHDTDEEIADEAQARLESLET